MRYKPFINLQGIFNLRQLLKYGADMICLLTLFYLTACPNGFVTPTAAADALNLTDSGWQLLEKGLELGTFKAPNAAIDDDALIYLLRIDPQYYHFKLLNASAQPKGRLLTAKQWCLEYGYTAAINAGMFQKDYKTSVSYMRTRNHINNPRLSKDMSLLAFDRCTDNVPLVTIIDRQCDHFSDWKNYYTTLIQSIRMISCKGINVWQQQPQGWSTAAVGKDRKGRILFIYVGSPYSTHDLINMIKRLPLAIDRAMYLEGGPQAQLYIKEDAYEFEFAGGGLIRKPSHMGIPIDYPIPNVIAIKPRPADTK
jgi:hypothetical protein